MPKFSVIMPSRLAMYVNAASNRDMKLIRAINSVIAQTFTDWELHVVADGCERTIKLVQANVADERVRLWSVEHKKLWAGTPRNTGIAMAEGEWIIYLDIDDVWGERHLEIINTQLNGYDWVWYNDIRYKTRLEVWYENLCDIRRLGKHGTSNIAHKKSCGVYWEENGRYSHDYVFVQQLARLPNGAKIKTPQYFVCHIPGTKTSGAYDL